VFLRLNKPGRDVPLAVLVPNMLTTLALCSGLASIHYVLLEQWERSLAAIVLAGIFDVLDGLAARLLRVQSRFGAVLDSLSDFLAFGVAPALIIHQWVLAEPTRRFDDTLGLVAVMTFAICSAMRLARYTANLGPVPTPREAREQKPKARGSIFFTGMPTPAGAGAVLVPAFLLASGAIAWRPPDWAVAAYTLVIALLMVSRVPMFALKGVRVPRKYAVLPLVLLVVLMALMIRRPWLTLAGLAGVYVLTIPWAVALHARRKREQPAETAGRVTPHAGQEPV